MAIIFENITKCPLCNDVLNTEKEYFMTPNLTTNQLDELFLVSDVGIHTECLNRSPFKGKLIKFIGQYDSSLEKMRILANKYNPREIINFNLLSSNESEPLYKYNYLVIPKQELKIWNELDDFIEHANVFLDEGKWNGLNEFNYLEYLVNTIKDISNK